MKLNVQTFITQHSNWENILSNAPYYINISRDIMFNHRLIMFKYNQIDSSFNNSIVCECRGLILDEMTLKNIYFGIYFWYCLYILHLKDLDNKS